MTDEQTTTPDPLIQIGRDLAYCRRRVEEVQTERTKLHGSTDSEDCRKRIWHDHDEKRLFERIDVLEQMTTEIRAESLRGVMVQLAMIDHFGGFLREFEVGEKETEAGFGNITKLLYSILRYLEIETKMEREEVFGDDYLYRDRDPDRPLLKAVASTTCSAT